METTLQLGDIKIAVRRKPIKNLHLSAHPPTGRVTISAPERMGFDRIRLFAIAKLDWIKRQQRVLLAQARETPRDFVERESHYVWGRRYLLTVLDTDLPPAVELHPRKMLLHVKTGTDRRIRRAIIERWYRGLIRTKTPEIIAKWEPILGVGVAKFYISRMKTKWGSCTPRRGTIRLNTELAKKPPECLEYVIAHEMVHLLEPTHNARFIALMDRHVPGWTIHRRQLNELPVPSEDVG